MSLGYLCCLDYTWIRISSLFFCPASVNLWNPFPCYSLPLCCFSHPFRFRSISIHKAAFIAYTYRRGRGRGGQRVFLGNLKLFRKGQGEFLTDEAGGGGVLIFSPLIKKGSIFLWIFFIKEDHPNCSMLVESFLAHLLYKYTPYRTFIINIKASVFIVKQLQNFNEKFNLSSTGKLPILLCLAVK